MVPVLLLISFISLVAGQDTLLNNRESSLLTGNTNRQDDAPPATVLANPAPAPAVAAGRGAQNGSGDGHEVLNGFLPLPPGYNKLAIPKVNGSAIFVVTFLSIREITDVDQEKGLLELDTELGFTWLDWEIWRYFLENKAVQDRVRDGPDEIILDSEFLKQIWKPDVLMEELASVDTTYLLSRQVTLAFLVRKVPIVGTIRATSRQTLRVRCEMDFKYYPADTQKCPLNLRSYTYPQDELFLLWAPNQSVYLDQTSDPNFDFQVSNVEPGESLYDLYTTYQAPCCTAKNFSTLTFTIQIRRNLTYHFVQTFLPSVLLILITWLCFLLPPDMVEARIGISMTTLLTIIAMFAAVREQAPDVSYTMAIDVWMVFCIFLIFLALVLFTVMYWMRWKWVRKPGQEAQDAEGGGAGAPATAAPPPPPRSKAEANGPPPPPPISPDDASEREKRRQKRYSRLVARTKQYAFAFFAIVFIVFLVLFGFWIVTASEYYEWAPSAKYNAVDEDVEGDANRLFTKQEAPFWANVSEDKKVVETYFRYVDLQNEIICPKLKEINPDDPCDAEEEYPEEEK